MLDSGLTTNLVSPNFLQKLNLKAEAEPMEGTAPGELSRIFPFFEVNRARECF